MFGGFCHSSGDSFCSLLTSAARSLTYASSLSSKSKSSSEPASSSGELTIDSMYGAGVDKIISSRATNEASEVAK